MSKIIPPMVSSSPPPMDDNLDEDDEDDEFGSFSTANFSYNLDITQPSKTSTNEEWEGNVKHQFDVDAIHLVEGKKDGKTYNDIAHHNGTHSASGVLSETYLTEEDEEVVKVFPQEIKELPHSHEMQQDNTSQDSVASLATDSGLCSASQDSEGTSPLPTVTGFMVSIPASNNVSQDESSSSDETLVKSSDTDLRAQLPVPSISDKSDYVDLTFDVGSKILSEPNYIQSDLNSIEQRLNNSKELRKENIQDQFPSISKKLMSNSTGQDNCDVSDCQSVSNNILTSEPTVSIFCNSFVNNVKTNADKDKFEQLPNNVSSDNQGKLLTNNNLNSVMLGCEINIANKSSRHLSNKKHLGNIGLVSDNTDECGDVLETIGNVTTNSKVFFPCDPNESDDDFSDFAFSEPPSLPVISSALGIKVNESFGSDDEFADFAFNETPSLSVTASAPIIKPNESLESDEEFADFAFSEVPSVPIADSSLVNKSTESFGSDDEFADFTSGVVEPSFLPLDANEERGWADESAMQLPTVSTAVNQIDDDFDDFETADFSSATVPTVAGHSQLASRLENVVTTLFPGPACGWLEASEPTSSTRRRMVDSNPVWGDLRDVDTSHALSYQWVSSLANKMLLSALGIDTRNILFGSKWNVAVPRFAANLGISPLEPVRAHSPPPLQPTREPMPKSTKLHPEASTSGVTEATVPDAQFDWNSSGLVNPLDCMEKDGHRAATSSHSKVDNGQQLVTPISSGGRRGISAEALKVLESLPNLSFLQSKTLIFPPPGQALTH